jgi:SWI/SNF-related matrix-associated actin-dependent regulator of chromatin subfamily A3
VFTAHIIRNSSTKSFKAATNLSANIRWCMTGTPIQNSLHDLRSLVKFLRVPQLDDTSAFRRHIAGNQKIGKGSQRPKPDYENLKMLLGSICLRRSISSLSLGVTCLEKHPQLSKVEERAYNELAKLCERSIKAVVSKRRAPKGSRAVLTALLRLRIFCNTGLTTLTQTGVTEEDSVEQLYPDEINSLFQQIGGAVCSECNCDILSIDTIDGLDQQLVDPNRRFKCQDCKQQIIASYDSGYSLRGHLSPVRQADPKPISLQKEDSRYDNGSNIYSSISGHPKYPSKLKAVLSDIMEHHTQEKR